MWIGHIDLVRELYEEVLLPPEVCFELSRAEARAPAATVDPVLLRLDDGERAAIALAASVKADAILMDDRTGVVAARARGFAVVGTLGILDAARRISEAGTSSSMHF